MQYGAKLISEISLGINFFDTYTCRKLLHCNLTTASTRNSRQYRKMKVNFYIHKTRASQFRHISTITFSFFNYTAIGFC